MNDLNEIVRAVMEQIAQGSSIREIIGHGLAALEATTIYTTAAAMAGLSACYLLLEKIIKKRFLGKSPNGTFDSGMKQKQAVIIDNIGYKDGKNLIINTIFFTGIFWVSLVPGSVPLLVQTAAYLAVLFPTFCLVSTISDVLEIKVSRGIKKLADTLEKKEYDVTVSKNFKFKWYDISQKLGARASEETKTIIYYVGHGSRVPRLLFDNPVVRYILKKPGYGSVAHCFHPEFAKKSISSSLSVGNAQDYELIGNISANIPGKKIVLIDSCMAGGMVDAAANLKEDLSGDIAIITSSKKLLARKLNPLSSSFLGYVEKKSDIRVSEFFEYHCKENMPSQGKKQFIRRISLSGYQPAYFAGKNMKITL